MVAKKKWAGLAAAVPKGGLRYLKAVLVSAAAGELVTILLLLAFSFVVCKLDTPFWMLDAFVLFAAAAGGLAAGYLVGLLLREKGLIFGALCGVAMLLVLFLLNIWFHQPVSLALLLVKLAVVLVCSALGGILGVNRRPRRVRL